MAIDWRATGLCEPLQLTLFLVLVLCIHLDASFGFRASMLQPLMLDGAHIQTCTVHLFCSSDALHSPVPQFWREGYLQGGAGIC